MGADSKMPTGAIDLSAVDWNKMSVSEFSELSKKFAERDKLLKSQKVRKKRDNGEMRVIRIDGKEYTVKSTVVQKLTSMRSEKSREKLLKKIRETSECVLDEI